MDNKKKGRLGEDLAVHYLLGKGYEVLDRNIRVGRFELDIIASKDDVLYFFEVKSSFERDGDSPLIRIDERKLMHLNRAVQGYLISKRIEKPYELYGLSVCVDQQNRKAKFEMVSCLWT